MTTEDSLPLDSPAGFVVAFITCPSQWLAETLAREAVLQQIAACAQVLGTIQSYYLWEGALCDESETLLLLKTHLQKQPALEALLKEHHPYDTPQLVMLPIEGMAVAYQRWMKACLSP
jgi:periplasmic divalent cation tolerance protein